MSKTFFSLIILLSSISAHSAQSLRHIVACAVRVASRHTAQSARIALPVFTQTKRAFTTKKESSLMNQEPQKRMVAAANHAISPQTIHKGLSNIFANAEANGNDSMKFWVVMQAHAEVDELERRLSHVQHRLSAANEHDSITYDEDHPSMVALKTEKMKLKTVIEQLTKDFIEIEY